MDHNFWLLREDENSYTDYRNFISRHDASVHLHDELLRYFIDTLVWIPTVNPAWKEMPIGYGLNWHGPTIINQVGGVLFRRICTSWAQLFTCGPERLSLQGLFSWQWPFDESEHLVREDQLHTLGRYECLEVERDWVVQMLTTLAYYGEQAATGEFFILHLGI